jgi:hypothetical protein
MCTPAAPPPPDRVDARLGRAGRDDRADANLGDGHAAGAVDLAGLGELLHRLGRSDDHVRGLARHDAIGDGAHGGVGEDELVARRALELAADDGEDRLHRRGRQDADFRRIGANGGCRARRRDQHQCGDASAD